MKTIGLICGSLRSDSYNRIIAQEISKYVESVQFQWIEIKDLPFFNEDLEVGGEPFPVAHFKTAIQGVDGILIVSPEYNSGMPGVLKNALDWASRPAKSSVMRRKPVGIMGATPGGMGTVHGQGQIRQVLESIQAHVMPFQKALISQVQGKVDSELKVLVDEKTKLTLAQYLKHFIHWMDHTPELDF